VYETDDDLRLLDDLLAASYARIEASTMLVFERP
jgi:hypothetical protein